MGMNQDDFIKAFKLALSDDSVIEKFDEKLMGPLRFEINNLRDSNNQLKDQIAKFSSDNVQLKKEVSVLREIVKSKDQTINSLANRIENIESTLDEHEQYSRRNTLRISGIPEAEDEYLQGKVLHLFNHRLKLNPPMMPDHIDRMHRVGRDGSNKPRTVMVKFGTYGARHAVYSNRKKFKINDQQQDQNTDESSSTDGPNSQQQTPGEETQPEHASSEASGLLEQGSHDDDPVESRYGLGRQLLAALDVAIIYVNEDLTKFRDTLLWKARKLNKAKMIKGCWSYDGRVMIQNNHGRVSVIRNEADLEHAKTMA